jgi:hypothetical protein
MTVYRLNGTKLFVDNSGEQTDAPNFTHPTLIQALRSSPPQMIDPTPDLRPT